MKAEMHIHPLIPGESAQQELVFRRNAALAEIFGANRRGAYAAMAAQTPLTDGVTITPVSSLEARGWWVQPTTMASDKSIFFVHGGGYHLGDAKSYLGFASQIAVLTQCAVFSVDYALAPEQPFPAAYNDVSTALQWMYRHGFAQIAAAGDSAGGGLVLAALDEPSHKDMLASVVVFSPWTDLAATGPSFHDPATTDRIFKPEILAGLAKS